MPIPAPPTSPRLRRRPRKGPPRTITVRRWTVQGIELAPVRVPLVAVGRRFAIVGCDVDPARERIYGLITGHEYIPLSLGPVIRRLAPGSVRALKLYADRRRSR